MPDPLRKIALATALYFGAVFTAGLIMGPIRALVLEPRFGPLIAITIEAPILLLAIVLAARWAPAAAAAPRRPFPLIAIGLGALTFQQIADVAFGTVVNGMTIAAIYAQFARPDGWVYAALLVAFAAMPWLLNRQS